MPGIELLEIAIGVVMIYLLLSLICTAVTELIEAFLKQRARGLERGIYALLSSAGDRAAVDTLVSAFYSHPLVRALYSGSGFPLPDQPSGWREKLRVWYSKTMLPAYIPKRIFALVILDLAGLNPAGRSAPRGEAPESKRAQELGAEIRAILQSLVDYAGGDMEHLRESIEFWYDSAMERVSGWYKRRSQCVVLILGLAIAALINADTVAITQSIAIDGPVRQALVSLAEAYASSPQPDIPIDETLTKIRGLGLPLGWDPEIAHSMPTDISGWVIKVIGWLMTAFAISLGAPFWFDLLKKIMNVRSTIKPTDEAAPATSADQAAQRGPALLPQPSQGSARG